MILSLEVVNFSRPFLVNFHTPVDIFDGLYNLNSEEAKSVSDHYPVWAEFYVNRDTD